MESKFSHFQTEWSRITIRVRWMKSTVFSNNLFVVVFGHQEFALAVRLTRSRLHICRKARRIGLFQFIFFCFSARRIPLFAVAVDQRRTIWNPWVWRLECFFHSLNIASFKYHFKQIPRELASLKEPGVVTITYIRTSGVGKKDTIDTSQPMAMAQPK